MKNSAIIFFFLLLSISLTAQIDTVLRQMEEFLQDVYLDRIEDEENVDLGEEWADNYFQQTKFNVNTLSSETAFDILHLSEYQYYQLLRYIELYGELLSLYELSAIEGFDEKDRLRLEPFLYAAERIEKKSRFKNLVAHSKHSLLFRYGRVLNQQAGYEKLPEDGGYLGSPDRFTIKYQWKSNHLSFGLAAEKDAGELLFKKPMKYGFDHYSFHAGILHCGIVKSFILGDYRLNWGQGLVMGSGLLSGKGGGVGAIRKFATDIRPITTMNEGTYLRGIATSLGKGKWMATLFYGIRQYDGELVAALHNKDPSFQGTVVIGNFHRTFSELQKKNSYYSSHYGARFQWQARLFKVGVSFVKNDFSVNIQPNSDAYKLYDFSGKQAWNTSVDYHWLVKNLIFFGEIAYSSKGGIGILNGLLLQPDPRIKIGLLHRYYSLKFIALEGQSFVAGNNNQAENGLYFTTDLLLGEKVECSANLDIFQFLWLKYRLDQPTGGSDMRLKCTYKLTRETQFLFRYQYKNRALNESDFPYYHKIVINHKHKFVAEMKYEPISCLQLKTQVSCLFNRNQMQRPVKQGYLLFQDVNFNIRKISLDIKLRIAVFNTDTYDERIYAYEQDLYYTFNISAYYYRGSKYYVIFKYGFRFFDIWVKYAFCRYENRHIIGSSGEQINEPYKHEIKVQFLFSF